MEKDIWRGIKAIRKESGRFRFPSSPFCFTLLNRESRKIGGVIVGGGKMEWKERKRVLTRRKNKNRLFLTSLFNLSLDRKICRVKGSKFELKIGGGNKDNLSSYPYLQK